MALDDKVGPRPETDKASTRHGEFPGGKSARQPPRNGLLTKRVLRVGGSAPNIAAMKLSTEFWTLVVLACFGAHPGDVPGVRSNG